MHPHPDFTWAGSGIGKFSDAKHFMRGALAFVKSSFHGFFSDMEDMLP